MSETNDKKTVILDTVKKSADKISFEIKDITKKAKETIKEKQEENKAIALERKKENDLKRLKPIFEEDLTSENFKYEKIIRIVNYDKRLENEVCIGSVGFYEMTKDRKIPTIYSKYIHKLGYSFYPQLSESVFIADPCIPSKFIEIDEYYNYMKQVRVNELTVIAQTLGAKHVNIAYTSSDQSSFSKTIKGNGDISGNIANLKGDGKKRSVFKRHSDIEIWADTSFKTSVWNGGPSVPTVLYFRNESDISSLIQMVLQNRSKVVKRTYRLSASSSSGIALTEAASISGAMKEIKCNAGANFEKKSEIESKSVLEYTIEF